MEERMKEIRQLWKQDKWLYVVAGFLVGIMFFPVVQSVASNLSGLLNNCVPEILGIGFTVLFIDRLNRSRDQEREAQHRLHVRLKKLLRSPSNEITSLSAKGLREQGLLQDGYLNGAFLSYANLQNVDLKGADFQGARLKKAKLQGADLSGANLQGVNLQSALLQGTNLEFAELQGADLKNAEFGETTIMPDGEKWTSETNLGRFTEP
jgi:hypothetical protein